MVAKSSAVGHLASIPLFAHLKKKDLQQVARATTEIQSPAGEVLVEEGSAGHELFIILEGTAEVRRNGRRVTTLGPGDYFGELAILDRGERSATVSATTDMTVMVLSQRDFAGLLGTIPGMSHQLLSSLAGRVRAADTRALFH